MLRRGHARKTRPVRQLPGRVLVQVFSQVPEHVFTRTSVTGDHRGDQIRVPRGVGEPVDAAFVSSCIKPLGVKGDALIF